MYTRMPVDSVQTTVTGPVGLEALSSTDGHTASTLVWNLSGVEQAVTVNLGGTPFSHGQLRVYRIDANHCSYTENHTQERLVPCEVYPEIATQGLTWTGPLDHECVIFFEVNDGSGLSELTTNPVANVLRVNHYYPDRTTRAYADFDKNTWIARLGMEGERTADCEVGVTAEAMPDHVGIRVEVIEPLESLSANSLFGIRVDYRVNGRYTKGVLYHGQCQSSLDLYHPGRTASVPHGTRRQPDEVVAVTDLSAFDLDIASHAPFGWDGRAQIMVILQDAGPSASVKVSFFRPA
jgi:hypothetical protein